MGSFWTKYITFDLKKYRGVMFDGTEQWCKIWLCFPKRLEELGLQIKMAELNQNKNLKQLDHPGAVRKLYFTLEKDE